MFELCLGASLRRDYKDRYVSSERTPSMLNKVWWWSVAVKLIFFANDHVLLASYLLGNVAITAENFEITWLPQIASYGTK